MNIQHKSICRSNLNMQLFPLPLLAILLAFTLAGCVQPLPMSQPVAKPGTLPIKHSWTGFWIRPAAKSRPAFGATIYPWNRGEYLVAIYVGSKSHGFFKAWPVKIAGHNYLQCQWFSPHLLFTPSEKAVAVKKVLAMKSGYYKSLFLNMIKASHHGFIHCYEIVQVTQRGQNLVVHPFIGPLSEEVNAKLPSGGFANAKAIRAFVASKQGRRLLRQRTWVFERTGRKAFRQLLRVKPGVPPAPAAAGKKQP